MDEKCRENWQKREQTFAAFTTGQLLTFWQTREECQFEGAEHATICYVRFIAKNHNKVIILVPGRIESYIKYSELACDLFHCGYDVIIIDHRGQGKSDRLLPDSHRGHVVRFSHYIDDLEMLCQHERLTEKYPLRYALAHSMGAAILSGLLIRQPGLFTAAVLSAPMFDIVLPLPRWLANRILDWAEECPAWRNRYALGTGRWQAWPFLANRLTHSRVRYQRNIRLYADDPDLRMGGPTYHWVYEGLRAGQEILSKTATITTPLMVLQAEQEKIVSNAAIEAFCTAMQNNGKPCYGAKPYLIAGARHEIFFEKDNIRAKALQLTMDFFLHHDQ